MTLGEHRDKFPAAAARPPHWPPPSDIPARIIITDGIARVAGVSVATMAGMLESGLNEHEVWALYATPQNGLTLDDVGAAGAFARRKQQEK